MSEQHVHDKGRDCARTDEVLDNYRRRAIAAEAALLAHLQDAHFGSSKADQ